MIATIDGKQLETLTIAPIKRDTPTLVLLHPGLGSIELWKDFPQRLVESTGLSALVYSRYGYGRSEPLKEKRNIDYLHHEARIVLPEVLERFEITRPILVGHSDGGTIALLYASFFPGGTEAIIVEAPHVFVEDLTIAGLEETKASYDRGSLRKMLAPYHTDVDATFRGWNDIWLESAFRSWNVEAALSQIICPVLVIQGEEDQYGTIAQLNAIKTKTPRTELYMIANCRHSPHQDQPELVLSRVEQFLQSVLTEERLIQHSPDQ